MFSRAGTKCPKVNKLWRRRVGVEPTIRSAKGRIGGFEGRDSHRTIFASAWIIDHHDWASVDSLITAGLTGEFTGSFRGVDP
jgi:hypothetical protein